MIRAALKLLPEEATAARDFLRAVPETQGDGHLARALRYIADTLAHECARAGAPTPRTP